MSNSFLEVCGVRCYEENGVAFLHIEDVARGLGFERTEIKNGVEYKSFRWERVDGFLNDLCFRPQVGEAKNQHDYYIPENIFYRLCMKANNSFAKKFQETVANDVLPKLRKHGVYMTDSVLEQTLQNPDFLINILQEYKKEKAEKEKAIIERDEAIRTKACISSKREATLMVAKREDNKKINRLTCENNELKEQNEDLQKEKDKLFKSFGCTPKKYDWLTVSVMRDIWQRNFKKDPQWQDLKRIIKENNLIEPIKDVKEIVNNKEKFVNRYPRRAWELYYNEELERKNQTEE